MPNYIHDDGEQQTVQSGVGKRQREEDEQNTSSKVARTPSSKDAPKWDDGLHRELVSAIFEIGLGNASPAVILENMIEKSQAITSERVKSKLQKYRNNKDKSKQEFMDEYDAFMARLRTIDGSRMGSRAKPSPVAVLGMLGCSKLSGGDAAAFLTFIELNSQSGSPADVQTKSNGDSILSSQLRYKDVTEYLQDFAGAGIPLPKLTEDERRTPLGESLINVMTLFRSMTQTLMMERHMAKMLTKQKIAKKK